jgi:hypothetical protein
MDWEQAAEENNKRREIDIGTRYSPRQSVPCFAKLLQSCRMGCSPPCLLAITARNSAVHTGALNRERAFPLRPGVGFCFQQNAYSMRSLGHLGYSTPLLVRCALIGFAGSRKCASDCSTSIGASAKCVVRCRAVRAPNSCVHAALAPPAH